MNPRICLLLFVAGLAFAFGCATKRPVLYPNGALQRNGRAQAVADIDTCIASAEAYGAGTNQATRVAVSSAKGAAVGAAAGGAYGAVRGDAGRRAAGGAAAGASVGFLRGLFRWRDPESIERRFVSICLSKQGYQIIGWR